MRRAISFLILFAGLLLGLAMNTRAQTYDISWYKIAGGGGTSTGGVYTVSGTIGQHDAGTMSGGSYSLTGGFWGIIAAIQTPGSPFLSIRTTNSNAIISWPATSASFRLEQSGSPTTNSVWTAVNATTYPVVVNNGTNTVTIPIGGNQYFRLINP